MTNYLIFLPILVSFFIVLFVIPKWIDKTKRMKLEWQDMNKLSKNKVSGSGGIIAVLGFVIGVLVYVGYITFILETRSNLVEIFALLTVCLFLGGVGFIDDLLGWQKGGLRKRHRVLLVLIASMPLIAINVGKPNVFLPYLGDLDLHLIYPLVLVPIGLVGATVTFNFLAGFNGLEAGQGIILLSALGFVSYFTGAPWLSVICLCAVSSLIAFLIYNKFPAKIFPGDSLTYCIGGLIAIISIMGNFEKIAIFFFIPYIIETVLKSRGGLKKYSFGKPNKQGSLDLLYDKIYSLNHLSILILKKIGIRSTEQNATILIWIFQIIIVILGILAFKDGIFLR